MRLFFRFCRCSIGHAGKQTDLISVATEWEEITRGSLKWDNVKRQMNQCLWALVVQRLLYVAFSLELGGASSICLVGHCSSRNRRFRSQVLKPKRGSRPSPGAQISIPLWALALLSSFQACGWMTHLKLPFPVSRKRKGDLSVCLWMCWWASSLVMDSPNEEQCHWPAIAVCSLSRSSWGTKHCPVLITFWYVPISLCLS